MLLLLGSVPSFAQQEDVERYYREQRESLRGLDRLTLFISVPKEFDRLFAEEMAVRARLEKGGVKLNMEGPATLLVSIYARYDARLKLYAVFLSVEVLQPATIKRTGKSEQAMTWIRRMTMICDARCKTLDETLAVMLDNFISDFQMANSPRRT
jgi:hypothetical protein